MAEVKGKADIFFFFFTRTLVGRFESLNFFLPNGCFFFFFSKEKRQIKQTIKLFHKIVVVDGLALHCI